MSARKFLANNKVNIAVDISDQIPGVATGKAIFIKNYREATLCVFSGDGASVISVILSFFQSPDGLGSWTPISIPEVFELNTENAMALFDISLHFFSQPWIRVDATLSLTGAASMMNGVHLTLSKPEIRPVV